MKLHTLILGIVLIAVVGIYFTQDNSLSLGTYNTPESITMKTSGSVTVGPDTNVSVVATTSRRAYLRLENTLDATAAVYCEANNDADATSIEGILLGTTTPAYEFTANRGNLYAGTINCTSVASSTLLVTEFVY